MLPCCLAIFAAIGRSGQDPQTAASSPLSTASTGRVSRGKMYIWHISSVFLFSDDVLRLVMTATIGALLIGELPSHTTTVECSNNWPNSRRAWRMFARCCFASVVINVIPWFASF